MINVIKINSDEFKNNIYGRYVSSFPENERRYWRQIIITYNKNIESFYKIILDDKVIGFFMLEKLDNYPYYLDYFAIYEEYQNKGYGKESLKYLLDNIILDDGLILDIEKIDDNNSLTIKRFKFYERLGFKKYDSVYLLFNVLYTPIGYLNGKYTNDEIDKIFFEYYKINVGEKAFKKNCKIIDK